VSTQTTILHTFFHFPGFLFDISGEGFLFFGSYFLQLSVDDVLVILLYELLLLLLLRVKLLPVMVLRDVEFVLFKILSIARLYMEIRIYQPFFHTSYL
jgi:hypothetical protein